MLKKERLTDVPDSQPHIPIDRHLMLILEPLADPLAVCHCSNQLGEMSVICAMGHGASEDLRPVLLDRVFGYLVQVEVW